MRTVLTIILGALLSFSFSTDIQAQQTKDKEVTLDVSMTCKGCKNTVETGLEKELGVKSAKANLWKKTVQVTFDPTQTSEDKLIKSLEELGYTASVKADEKEDAQKSKNEEK